MTTISAKVIAHSISPFGKELLSIETESPRWIHAEGRTHRLHRIIEDDFVEIRTPSLMEDSNLSRNAASSRAIPVERMIASVLENPAIPLFWGAHQSGMQADHECDALVSGLSREEAWLHTRDQAVNMARAYAAAGYHKQVVNRILEPYSHIKVLFTATELKNFLALRLHRDAEPHIRMLAEAIRDAIAASTPRLLEPGQWHLPYVEGDDWERAWELYGERIDGVRMVTSRQLEALKMISGARCASLSYKTVDGKLMTFERAEALTSKLITDPLHASPFEHQATPDTQSFYERIRVDGDKEELVESGLDWDNPKLHGNLVGWIQQRKTMPNEAVQG